MGPSVRSILHRIESGERVSPEQVRVAVSILHECYENVLETRAALDDSERMLRDDLSSGYSGFKLSKSFPGSFPGNDRRIEETGLC